MSRALRVKNKKELESYLSHHRSIDEKESPPGLADEVAKLRKEVAKLRKEIAHVRHQSQKAFDKGFRAEMIWLTLILNQQAHDE